MQPGVDVDLAQYLATLGGGGILAGVIFAVYRKDVREYAELWKGQAELWKGQVDTLILVVKDNTAANTKLTAVIEALHRRLDRNGDLAP